MKRVLVFCDGATSPPGIRPESFSVRRHLNHRGPSPNVNLRIESPRHALLTSVEGRPADLVRIAAYAYGADQAVSRGGPTDVYGDEWERDFTICLPISDPAFWNTRPVMTALQRALAFASGDRWTFHFTPLTTEDAQLPFNFNPNETLGDPDSVFLFSGGLDSLCAVVEAAFQQGRRPVLVRHLPSNNITGRQRRVIEALKTRFGESWHFPSIQFPTHRVGEKDPADTSQRTRAFLFAAQGAVVADRLGIAQVAFADNGVVSLNLPINRQLLGSTASRSTHPKTVRLFNDLARLVFERPLEVVNPLWSRTRTEALEILSAANAETLVRETYSCAHHRTRTAKQPFCGVCSQCIDRRFAAIAAGVDRYDPGHRYELDIFRDPLPSGHARTMVLSYVRFALEVEGKDDHSLLLAFPELIDALDPQDRKVDGVARALCDLVRRHAATVLGTLESECSRVQPLLVRPELPPTNLLRLVTAPATSVGKAFLKRPRAADLRPAHEPGEAQRPRYAFKIIGEYWTLVYEDEVTRLHDSVGLRYLHYLLERPGTPVPVLELLAMAHGSADDGRGTSYRTMSPGQLESEGLSIGGMDDRMPLADAQAIGEYRETVRDLEQDLAEAEQMNDMERASHLREQRDVIAGELGRIFGLGGRVRATATPMERARSAVTMRFNAEERRIKRSMPELGAHLANAIHTGRFCVYEPDREIVWEFENEFQNGSPVTRKVTM
jgi:7-cyano-7-deazaguanine synthase in queuosine biosynthesis